MEGACSCLTCGRNLTNSGLGLAIGNIIQNQQTPPQHFTTMPYVFRKATFIRAAMWSRFIWNYLNPLNPVISRKPCSRGCLLAMMSKAPRSITARVTPATPQTLIYLQTDTNKTIKKMTTNYICSDGYIREGRSKWRLPK